MEVEGTVVVSRRGQARVEAGHPWVHRTDVVHETGIGPGALVRVEGGPGRQ